MPHLPPVLIEDWLPFEAVGAESQRDASAARKPPLNRLHVWFARRPLTVSRAAILASVLPQWSTNWPRHLHERFPDEASYQAWFMNLLGILGDPVAGRKLIQEAKEKGEHLRSNPYNAPRAFTVNPSADDLKLLRDLLEYTWGTRDLVTMDVTAGGGSIPFEALRYGFTTYANELNPVASIILKATLDYPARFGVGLADDIRKWGAEWARRVNERLAAYFPRQSGENIFAYLWARTVVCPVTGKPVPLSPNWWLSRGDEKVAVQLLTDPAWDVPQFAIKRGDAIDFDPDGGTVSRGVGISPWTGEAIDGEYIKAEAQAGRMGQMLYTVAVKRPGGFDFRAPTAEDLEAVRRAETTLAEKLPMWEAVDLAPMEDIPKGNKTDEPRRYGFYRWCEVFSPRQLLSMLTFLEVLRELAPEMRTEVKDEARAAAVETYLSFVIDKAADRNDYQTRWIPQRLVIANTFDRHDFAMKWSFAEFDASANLLTWGIDQIFDAYSELVELASPSQYALWKDEGAPPVERLRIFQGAAANLEQVPDGSVHNITFDPPYYDNVMYAELSDFFYVWLKRSVGHLFPEFFRDHLTNKDDEAVANVARFASMGRSKKKLAEQDYERKMEAIFRECNRILRGDGVLTIMFTHKRVEAWDTLAAALINAGFMVQASWPVHTEFEHSLHQAKKNAAASTILLVCRKRQVSSAQTGPVWWEDIKGQVGRIAREKAAEFAAQGVRGVDLYISVFGPALSVISANWPVLTSEIDEHGEPKPIRPETALDLARQEVIALRMRGLLLGRDIEFDPFTDWYLMAWDAFKAMEFPYDEARKLALALGVDLDKDIRDHKRLVARKSSSVVIQTPLQRRRKGMVDPDLMVFEHLVDAVHTALLVLGEDGASACEAFLKRTNLLGDGTFRQCVQAMLNAIPRTKTKGQWVRPEAELLERLRLNFYPDLDVPVEEALLPAPEQLGFDIESEEGEEGGDE